MAVDVEDGDTEIVLRRSLPRSLVAVEDFLVVSGIGWVALPLSGD